MDPIRVKIEFLRQGYIEILANKEVKIHLFDTLDLAYDDAKRVEFIKIVEHPIDANYPAQDEADICTTYSLSRENFIKELGVLKITTMHFNGELIDKDNLVLF